MTIKKLFAYLILLPVYLIFGLLVAPIIIPIIIVSWAIHETEKD